MESKSKIVLVTLMAVLIGRCLCADPNSVEDYCVGETSKPSGAFGYPCAKKVSATDFKTSMLAKPGNTKNSLGSALTIATASSFAALNGQGLSFARIDYAKGGVVQPHLHPRASEVIFVLKGTLEVGFVDSQKKHFPTTIKDGELFVFPKAMVHYIANVGDGSAVTLSALDSQNPGAILLAPTLFAAKPSPLPENVLSPSFKLSPAQLRALESSIQKSS